MIQFKPYLFVRRLAIISSNGVARYDEQFHDGVNIVRGQNGSGKSTIMNALFYGLGGDFAGWTQEIQSCSTVYVEVEIDGGILTLKREISALARRPMSIYFGDYDSSLRSNFEGWKVYPYQASDDKESFSNIIFSALGYPQIKTEADNKITLHQVLRLIFIDQLSPLQGLFRSERFDTPLMRQAIAELLLGVYDDELYNKLLDSQL